MFFTENSFIIFATLTGEHLGIPSRVYACSTMLTCDRHTTAPSSLLVKVTYITNGRDEQTCYCNAGDNADNIQLHLNQDLENVHNWLRANKLTLNMTKTEFMPIGSRQRLSTLTESPTIAINDFQVSQVTTAKLLGVTIDDRLDWSGHIEKVTKQFASGIGAIKRIRHLVPQATLQLIYQALIQPHFDYCNIVWGNCGITLRNKVQKLQNRAARVLTYSSYDVDAGYLFKLLGWKNLACQQQITRATMVYRSLHGLAPNYLSSKFERREVAYNLRDSEN